MKRTIIIVLLIALAPAGMKAQQSKVQTITDSALVLFPSNKSLDEVEQETVDKAILNGIEHEFGRVIMEGDQSYIMNLQTNAKVKTTDYFTQWAGTYVIGKCLGIKDKKCEETRVRTEINGQPTSVKAYRCTVTFSARRISAAEPEFEAYTLFSPTKRSRTTEFIEGEPLYLYFNSTSSGFLSVYLEYGKECQRLLPYKRMDKKSENGVYLDRDKDYFFFSTSEEFNYFGSMDVVDPYVLVPDNEMDQYKLYVIFSKDEVVKPKLAKDVGSGSLSNEEKEKWTFPEGLSSKEFQLWLSKKQTQNSTLTVSMIPITVKKKE